MAGCLRLFRLEFTDNYTKIGNRIGLLRSWLWFNCALVSGPTTGMRPTRRLRVERTTWVCPRVDYTWSHACINFSVELSPSLC
jgi:hypothetical protein